MDAYKFKNLPLTPSMIEDLIITLLDGKTLKRDSIVKIILDFHISNGGLNPEANDISRSVKKALSNLQEKGYASNKAYGHWEISKNESQLQIDEPTFEKYRVEIDDIPSHKIYGKGDFAVYLYYFPTYKILSESKGQSTWPCKIGRTDRDPLLRIISQVSTALPEVPTIEFIIKSDDSFSLEKMIHSVLAFQGKNIKDSPGVEWFDTNPNEVLEIIKFVKAEILE